MFTIISQKPEEGVIESYKGQVEYEQVKPGRIEFLQNEKHSFEISLKKIDSGVWQIEVDGNKSSDAKDFKSFFEKTLSNQVSIDDIEYSRFNTASGILFLDRLSHEGLGNKWNIEDISHISLKRGLSDPHKSNDE